MEEDMVKALGIPKAYPNAQGSTKIGAVSIQLRGEQKLPGNSVGIVESIDAGGRNVISGGGVPLPWFKVTLPALPKVPAQLRHDSCCDIWQVWQAISALGERVYYLNPIEVLMLTPISEEELLRISDDRAEPQVTIRNQNYSSHDGAYLSQAQVSPLTKLSLLRDGLTWTPELTAMMNEAT